MGRCDRSTVGSLVLGRAGGGGGGFRRLWPLSFSAAALRRRLVDAVACGAGRRSRKGGGGGFGSGPPPEKKTSPPPPRKRTGPGSLSELLKADMSEPGSDEEEEEEAEAETRRKTAALEEIQGVVNRLQGERKDQRKEAARDVRSLAKRDAEARQTLAMLGAIPPLVSVLDATVDVDLQVESLYALLNLGIGNDMNKAAIVAAGAVHKMLQLVDTRSPVLSVSEAIAANFLGLSALDANKPIIGAASGAIPFLAGAFRGGGQARQDALRALFNLSLAAVNLPRLVAAGLVPDLLASVGDMDVTDRALAVLSNVVSAAEGRRAVAREPEAFQILGDVLNWVDSPGCQERAAYVLMVMAHKSYVDRAAMSAAGVASPLLELTLMGTALAQRRASRVLECLREDKGKGVSEGFEGVGAALPALSAPLCGASAEGRRAEAEAEAEAEAGEEAGMNEERRAVRRLVQESLQSNMRRVVRRANLPQDLAPPPDHLRPTQAAGATSKSVPF